MAKTQEEEDFMRWGVELMTDPGYMRANMEHFSAALLKEARRSMAYAQAYERLRTLLPDVFDEYLREELERVKD